MQFTPEMKVLGEIIQYGLYFPQIAIAYLAIQVELILVAVALTVFFALVIGGAGLYLFLPAYIANMVPVGASALFRRLGWRNAPIWESRLGRNKTWVGTSAGLLATMFAAWAQTEFEKKFPFVGGLRPEGVRTMPWPFFGLLMGVGALVIGDMAKSLVKRTFGIAPGKPWKPWDDLDYGFGTSVVLLPFVWQQPHMLVPMAAGVAIGYYANPIVNRLSHRAGVKAVPH